jgi:hypothetical protein
MIKDFAAFLLEPFDPLAGVQVRLEEIVIDARLDALGFGRGKVGRA